MQHGLNGCVQEARDVVGVVIGHARWERAFFQFGHAGFHAGDHVAGVGAGPLLEHDSRRRPPVGFGQHLVAHRPKLYLGHVFQAQQRAIGVGAQHQVFVLLRLEELAGVAQHVLERLRVAVGALARFAGGRFHVLLPNGRHHVLRRHFIDGHAVGLEPHAHRIVAVAHDGGKPHAVDAFEFG